MLFRAKTNSLPAHCCCCCYPFLLFNSICAVKKVNSITIYFSSFNFVFTLPAALYNSALTVLHRNCLKKHENAKVAEKRIASESAHASREEKEYNRWTFNNQKNSILKTKFLVLFGPEWIVPEWGFPFSGNACDANVSAKNSKQSKLTMQNVVWRGGGGEAELQQIGQVWGRLIRLIGPLMMIGCPPDEGLCQSGNWNICSKPTSQPPLPA